MYILDITKYQIKVKKLKKIKIVGISAILAILLLAILIGGAILYLQLEKNKEVDYKLLGETKKGSVEKLIYGNASAENSIAIITGIHPRETLSIEPEIKAAKEFADSHNVKIIHYQVNVTKNPQDYAKGRKNGEKLVHDFVNPDVTQSDADCVIISHSHIPNYGQGFYLATPNMDEKSVIIASTINKTSDFNYYPKTGNESYKSTSAVLVSNPIAQAGYATFVYEIPENITEQESTDKTKELLDLMIENAC